MQSVPKFADCFYPVWKIRNFVPQFFSLQTGVTKREFLGRKILSRILSLISLFNKINNLRKLQTKRKLPISEASLAWMVRQAGFEPTTPWFVARYSIQLSYWRTSQIFPPRFLRSGAHCIACFRLMQVFLKNFLLTVQIASKLPSHRGSDAPVTTPSAAWLTAPA